MSGSYWKTGAPKTRSSVERPKAGQVLVQLGIALAVIVMWGSVLAGVMSVVKAPASTAVVNRGKPRSPAVKVTLALTVAPATTPATSTPVPTATVSQATGQTQPAPAATDAATATTVPASPTMTTTTSTAPIVPTKTPTATSPTEVVSYARDVQPLFNRICVKCHGGENTNASLVLKTYADLMQGSENGPVIDPGNSKDSLLIDLVTQGKMPKKGPKLLPAQIRLLTQWVDAGAPNN